MTEKCADCAARTYDSEYQHVPPSDRHCRLLASYLMNLDRGVAAVQAMIKADVHRFRDMGASRYASDLEIVLACFAQEFEAASAA